MGSPQQEGEVEKPHAKMPDWIRWESMLSCQLEAPNYFMCKSSNSNSFLLVLVHNLSGRDTHNQFRSINHTGVQLPLDLSFQQDCSPGNKHARPTLFRILIGKQKVYSLTAATSRVYQSLGSPPPPRKPSLQAVRRWKVWHNPVPSMILFHQNRSQAT